MGGGVSWFLQWLPVPMATFVIKGFTSVLNVYCCDNHVLKVQYVRYTDEII